MKVISIKLLLILLSNIIYASQLSWVDEQVEAIKPPRRGVEIIKMKDPFVFLQKNRPEIIEDALNSVVPNIDPTKLSEAAKEKESSINNKVFILNAIINTSALIDGIWYNINDKIDDYTIIDITKTTAILKKSDKMVVLSTSTKAPTIKFKNK